MRRRVFITDALIFFKLVLYNQLLEGSEIHLQGIDKRDYRGNVRNKIRIRYIRINIFVYYFLFADTLNISRNKK